MRKGIISAAALVLCLTMSACGISEQDVKTLVQGNLDEIYLDKANSDYMKLVDMSEAEIHQVYEDGLDVEVDTFLTYFEILDDTDERKEEIKDFYRQVYAKSCFQVGEPKKQNDDTFVVPVEIDPLDIFELVTQEDVDAAVSDVLSEYTVEEQAAMSDNDFEVVWADAILRVCNDKLPEMGTLDPVTVEVTVEKNSEKVFTITDDSLAEVDLYIISY